MSTTLVIGNKNYSSWSLRPWLFMKVNGIPFDEVRIPLYTESAPEQIRTHSPAGKVPVLIEDGVRTWDSLAILEVLNERHPAARGLPEERADRAWARSLCAEMHAGFRALRTQLPMNCRRPAAPVPLEADAAADVARVRQIWRECRQAHPGAGPFLFGAFTMADAMYAPVVVRFEGYQIRVGPLEREYMDAVLALPAMRAWIEAARAETEVIAAFERT
jgi:glutathione S-transferase